MTTSKLTPEEIQAALEVVRAVADAIQALGSVPSGHLYARLAGHMNLTTYHGIIASLKKASLVEERNHELFWIGAPKA